MGGRSFARRPGARDGEAGCEGGGLHFMHRTTAQKHGTSSAPQSSHIGFGIEDSPISDIYPYPIRIRIRMAYRIRIRPSATAHTRVRTGRHPARGSAVARCSGGSQAQATLPPPPPTPPAAARAAGRAAVRRLPPVHWILSRQALGRCCRCSPRHRMPFYSRNEGLNASA